MKKRNSIIACMIFALVLIYIAYVALMSREPSLVSDDGVFDLSGISLEDSSLSLDGKFVFYPNELVGPGQEAPGILTDGDIFWNGAEGRAGEEWMQGTYRATILLDPSETSVGVMIPEIYTESRVWINGNLVQERGFYEEKDVYSNAALVDIGKNIGRIDILVQVRNTRHVKSGIESAFRIGAYKKLNRDMIYTNALDLVFFGICFIAGVYHLVLFIHRKGNRELLYFSMLAISAGIRGVFANSVLLTMLLGDMTYLAGSRILTVSTALSVAFAILYIEEIFRDKINHRIFGILKLSVLAYSALVLLTGSPAYSGLFDFFLIFAVIASLYLLKLLVSEHLSGDFNAGVILFGMSILFLTMLNDILVYYQKLNGPYLVALGMGAYIIVQSLLIAWDMEKQYRESLRLTEELRETVAELESTQLAYLQAQMRPHFLYNTLNTIAELCIGQGERAESLVLSLASYLRGVMEFGSNKQEVALSKELELIGFYIGIEKERFPGLHFESHVPGDLLKVKVPYISLEPLVENAIKHGIRGVESGKIVLKAESDGDRINFTVTDNGVGMAEERLREVCRMETEAGKIGLGNIDKRLRANYGSRLNIESRPGQGTTAGYSLKRRGRYD